MPDDTTARGTSVRAIHSGAQTGADTGGLDAAIELGLQHGGFVPRGRRTEDGPVPDRYNVVELPTVDYRDRTVRNIKSADGTALFVYGAQPTTPGSRLTAAACRAAGKPLLIIDLRLDEARAAASVRRFVTQHGIGTLNVAGSRESKCPGISDAVRRILVRALS